MELYPIQQLLKQSKLKGFSPSGSHNKEKNNSLSGSSKLPMKDFYFGNVAKPPTKLYESTNTVSWNQRQEAKRRNPINLAPIIPAPVPPQDLKLSSVSLSNSTSNMPSRRYVVHLATEQDQTAYKMPLYESGVFDLRNQNEETLKHIVSNKEEFQKKYNKMASEHHFSHFRSEFNDGKQPLQPLLRNRFASPMSHNYRSSNNSLEPIAKFGQPSFQCNTQGAEENCHSLNTGTDEIVEPSIVIKNKKQNVLEGLEEIYQEDLLKQMHDHERKASIANPVANIHAKSDFKNYRNYSKDKLLLEQLKDPYGQKLPFYKPQNGGLKQNQIRELGEIEAKAEILRRIRHINESMVMEASPKPSLTNLKDRADEDTLKEKKKEEELKLVQKINSKRHGKKKGHPTARDLELFARYYEK